MAAMILLRRRILVLALLAALPAGCAAGGGPGTMPTPSSVPTSESVPTPAQETTGPTPVLTPTSTPTPRPAMEVAGRMTVVIDAPATTLEGAAACDIPEGTGPAVVGTVRAQDLGRVASHRVFGWVMLVLEGAAPGEVHVSLGQGMENLPPGAGMPEYAGLTGPVGVEMTTDGTTGSITFASLPKGERPFVGDSWSGAVSGRVSWTCDPIPSRPTPKPAGAVGTAGLSGSVSATFPERGDACPTSDAPDGFMTGTAALDGRDAILEVTIDPSGEAWFALYRTPGDKEDVVVGRGRARVEADEGGGWRLRLASAPTEIGPVTLDLRWRCGP